MVEISFCGAAWRLLGLQLLHKHQQQRDVFALYSVGNQLRLVKNLKYLLQKTRFLHSSCLAEGP